MRLLWLPLVLAACQGPSEEEPPPQAWEEAAAVDLGPMRPVRVGAIEGAEGVAGLRYEPRTALTFAIDPGADRIHILDEVWRHSARPRCIDAERVGEPDVPDWRGECEAGLVELHRGYVRLPNPVDVALDSAGLAAWAVSASGVVARIELDLLADNSLGWLRLGELRPTGLGARSAAWDGGLWLSTDDAVVRLDEDLTVVESVSMDQPRFLDSADASVVLARDGLHLGDSEPIPTPVAAAAGDFVVWWAEDALIWSDGVRVDFPEQPDSMAVDPVSGTAWVASLGDVSRVTREGERLSSGVNATALLVTATHDAALADQDQLVVLNDEQALVDAESPPIYLTNIAFLETPRSFEDAIACDAPNVDGDIARGLRTASFGRELMESLPGGWALGVTPRFAEGVLLCGQEERFSEWTDGPWESGVLMHQSTACTDMDCYGAFMSERVGRLRALGLAPTWIGGGSEHARQGLDPVLGALEVGLSRHLFFGLGLDPALDPEGPTWKEPWPARPGDGSEVFFASSVADLPAGASSGLMSFYPGNSVRGFAMGACAGLLVRECSVLSAGSDHFAESDIAALELLARHAVARRSQATTTWSWHLPDLTQFDYTEGCSRDESGWWSADTATCEATLLQELTWDLHQSLVLNGLARWAMPSELPKP